MSRGPLRKEWRPVPGFPRYEVSDQGDVRLAANGGRKLLVDTGDRLQVSLVGVGQKGTTRNVGALVLLAFVGSKPASGSYEVSHLDGDYRNNRPENLAWETHAENMARKRAHGTVLAGDRHGKTKLSDLQVRDIVARLAAGERGVDLAREYGVSATTISTYRKGGRACLGAQ